MQNGRFGLGNQRVDEGANGSYPAAPAAPYSALNRQLVESGDQSPLTLAIGNLHGLQSQAAEIHAALATLADRIGGPVPTAASDVKGEKIGERSHLDSLHGVITRLSDSINAIAAETARLNRLVG